MGVMSGCHLMIVILLHKIHTAYGVIRRGRIYRTVTVVVLHVEILSRRRRHVSRLPLWARQAHGVVCCRIPNRRRGRRRLWRIGKLRRDGLLIMLRRTVGGGNQRRFAFDGRWRSDRMSRTYGASGRSVRGRTAWRRMLVVIFIRIVVRFFRRRRLTAVLLLLPGFGSSIFEPNLQ